MILRPGELSEAGVAGSLWPKAPEGLAGESAEAPVETGSPCLQAAFLRRHSSQARLALTAALCAFLGADLRPVGAFREADLWMVGAFRGADLGTVGAFREAGLEMMGGLREAGLGMVGALGMAGGMGVVGVLVGLAVGSRARSKWLGAHRPFFLRQLSQAFLTLGAGGAHLEPIVKVGGCVKEDVREMMFRE